MFRRSFSSTSTSLLLCAATNPAAQAAAAATAKEKAGSIYLHNAEPILTDKGATPEKFGFAKRYEQLRKDPDSALASDSYEALMSNLKAYDELLRTYSVKQTEMERAKRAANMCGLEMTKDPFAGMKNLASQQQRGE